MGVPRNIMRALCAVIRPDHLKFASYGPVFNSDLYTRFLHRSGVNSLRARSALVVWTAVILNSIEATGPISNGWALKLSSAYKFIKSFGGQKGDSSEPPRTPPPGLRPDQRGIRAKRRAYIRA